MCDCSGQLLIPLHHFGGQLGGIRRIFLFQTVAVVALVYHRDLAITCLPPLTHSGCEGNKLQEARGCQMMSAIGESVCRHVGLSPPLGSNLSWVVESSVWKRKIVLFCGLDHTVRSGGFCLYKLIMMEMAEVLERDRCSLQARFCCRHVCLSSCA